MSSDDKKSGRHINKVKGLKGNKSKAVACIFKPGKKKKKLQGAILRWV